MNQLRGRLSITCIENVHDEKEAAQAELAKKIHLDDLVLPKKNHLYVFVNGGVSFAIGQFPLLHLIDCGMSMYDITTENGNAGR